MEIKTLINPKKELFRWGPSDGRPIFPDYWFGGFFEFAKYFSPGWPAALVFYAKEMATVIVDYEELRFHGEALFKKHILDDKLFKLNYAKWEKLIKNFEASAEKISKTDLKLLSDKEFFQLFQNWNSLAGKEFWNIGSLPEVANWGGEKILSDILQKFLKEEDFHYALERLSAPEDFSFYQKEEIDLLSLKNIKHKKSLEEKLKSHQQKYFWMLNSYHNTRILPVSYFRKRLGVISMKDAKRKIEEIEKIKKEAIIHKKKVIREFNLPYETLKISQRLSFCIWWQDFRKSYIFKNNYIVDLFLKEISRRFELDFDDLHFYVIAELEDLVMKNKKLSGSEIESRKDDFVAAYRPPEEIRYVSGSKAKKIATPYLNNKIKKDIKEIKGLVVNRGVVKGRVRIIIGSKNMDKIKNGEVLVTTMTTPDFIVALKKSCAVVTDEGGMTCHAAIVSRELGIPGIVGTKIATKVLKDGDTVEVDANKGIIKILNK